MVGSWPWMPRGAGRPDRDLDACRGRRRPRRRRDRARLDVGDESRTRALARRRPQLLGTAEGVPTGRERRLTQIEVALPEGSVFVARDGGSQSTIVATTSPAPASRLVFYDLETASVRSRRPRSSPLRSGAARRRKKKVDA